VVTNRPLTKQGLAILVEDYLEEVHKIQTHFDVEDAIGKLEEFGLIQTLQLHAYFKETAYTVLSLSDASQHLSSMTTADLLRFQQQFVERKR